MRTSILRFLGEKTGEKAATGKLGTLKATLETISAIHTDNDVRASLGEITL